VIVHEVALEKEVDGAACLQSERVSSTSNSFEDSHSTNHKINALSVNLSLGFTLVTICKVLPKTTTHPAAKAKTSPTALSSLGTKVVPESRRPSGK
jgi:hypothetical protein